MKVDRLRHVVAIVLVGISSSHAADQLDINAVIPKPPGPSAVSIERDKSMDPVQLSQVSGQPSYTATIRRPTTSELTQMKLAAMPYLLVGEWPDGKEPVYLEFNSLTPGKVSIPIMHEAVSAERATLDSIEALGTDYQGTLQRYFRARSFHRKWRHELHQPDHQVAIRSAKIWFDAAVSLVKYPRSYYRMDEEATRIMTDYEKHAANDPGFAKRLRMYAGSGYVVATLQQVAATRYRFVADIPELMAAGQYDTAAALNEKAIAVLENETPDMQKSVARRQGVNMDLLRANAKYISTRQAGEM